MATERTIKTKIVLEGEKEYSAALKTIKSDASLTSSEMQKLKSQYEGQLNSVDYLQRKTELLGTAYETAKAKVKLMADRLEEIKKIQSEYGEKVDATKQAIEALSTEMSNLDTSTESGAAAYAEMQQQLDELNQELKTNENTYAAAEDAIKTYQTQLNGASVSQRKLGQELDASKKYLKEAEESSDGCATSIDGFGKKAKSAAGDAKTMGTAVSKAGEAMEEASATTVAVGNLMADALEAAASKALELAASLKDSGIEYQQSLNKMSAATGATGDELERLDSVARNVFQRGLGDSLEDVYSGLTEVKTATGLVGDELDAATESGFALRDTFGFELQESARTVDSLIKNFGVTAAEAYNIIAVGAQNGANKNGDLLDVLNEYSAQYSALGLSADQFIQSLISGADQGVFSIDKVGDAVKEFNIRAKDGSTTSQEAFELLGMSADNMTAKFAAGGKTAQEAMFEVVSALQTMEDPVKKNAAAVGLFGTMYEDLEANLLPILASMEDASENAYDAMGQINEIRYNDLQTQWEAIKRKIITGALPQLNTALQKVGDTLDDPKMVEATEEIGEGLGDLAETAGDLAETALPVLAKGLGLVVDAAGLLIDHLPELATGLAAYKGAAVAAEIAQNWLNLTMSASPIGLIAGLVVGLGTAFAGAVVEANGLDETTRGLNDALQNTTEKAASERSELDKNKDTALNLISQIETLSAVENKSAAQKEKLQSLVASLNSIVPELGLSYDKLTDSISMSADEMREFVLQSAKMQALESYQDELSDLYVEQAKALDALNDKKSEAFLASQRYTNTQKDLNKQLADGTIDQQMYDSALAKAKTEMDLATGAAEDAQDAYDNITDAVGEAEQGVLDYSDALGGTTEATDEVTEATEEELAAVEAAEKANEEYQQSIQEMAEALEEAGVQSEGLAQKLVDQGISVSEAESAIDRYKDTTLDAFSEIEEKQDVSVESMISTLEHNTAMTQQWADGIGQLYAQAGNDAEREFLSYLEGLGPEYMTILNQLTADTSGELLGSLVSAWSAGGDAAKEAALVSLGMLPEEAAAAVAQAADASSTAFSENTAAYTAAGQSAQAAFTDGLAEIVPGSSSVLQDLQSEIENRLSAIDKTMAKYGQTAGTSLTSKMQAGINSGSGGIRSAANSAATGAYSAIQGRSWSSLGYNLSAGVASGISSGSYLITAAANRAVDNALASARRRAGVRSPSTKWRDELGKWLPAGAGEGVEEGTPAFVRQVTTSMDKAMDAAKESLRSASGVNIYDFIPTLDSVAPRTTVYNSTTSVRNVSQNATDGDDRVYSVLSDILVELKSTGGITTAQVARALAPAIDDRLGTELRRKERST